MTYCNCLQMIDDYNDSNYILNILRIISLLNFISSLYSILFYSDLEDCRKPWFFLQLLYSIKTQIKRGLEELIVALKDGYVK